MDKRMLRKNKRNWIMLFLILLVGPILGNSDASTTTHRPYRILLDTDVDTDDFFALLYILKLNQSEFDLKAVTINTNAWTNAGHAVNHVYDMLFMMGRDDIRVGVGGEGGILEDGTILPDVGGYLPIIEQGMTTSGYCRYRQAIPVGHRGRLDIDTNFGIRKAFLPQGKRKYKPLQQPTAQQVMIDTICEGPTTVILLGAHTNFAIFLMSNPQLKSNVEQIYTMGGGIRSTNPDCCLRRSNSKCEPQQCGDLGNLFTAHQSNPYAEFNMFGDPFAAYQVIHSGIPVTLVPLDATNTVPISKKFLQQLEQNQRTYEAQYCFKSLKMAHDAWCMSDQFYKNYFMWDSFTAGVAISIMRNPDKPNGENEFSVMEYMNITIVTSNQPYGISDGSNPFFDGKKGPRFGLSRGGVHSGHIQMGLRDPFCLVVNGRGRCEDGHTKESTEPEAVQVLVAKKAKLIEDPSAEFNTQFVRNFLDVINRPQQSGRLNITTQFRYYNEAIHNLDFGLRNRGKPVIFDMDMSVGDFLALFYLLKVPRELLDLKAIFVTPTGWASAATIDIVYDLLHMMSRDDIPVGLGDFFATNQSDIGSVVGDCKYAKAIPSGNGGLLDSDTLYGLGRSLPRSPRRYTAGNSGRSGALSGTEPRQLRQPLALEIWEKMTRTRNQRNKFTILTNGPLTTLANIIMSDKNSTSMLQDVFIVGGHIYNGRTDTGNVFTIPSNSYAEFNMFLDPVAAKTVFESEVDIKLIPLGVQRKISSFSNILGRLNKTRKTPEVLFARCLLHQLHHLQKQHFRYQHMEIFLGEILGAVILASDSSDLHLSFNVKRIRVVATGNDTTDGQLETNKIHGKPVNVLEKINPSAYYHLLAKRLGNKKQSAVLESFSLQKRLWSTPRRHPKGQTENIFKTKR